MVCSTAKEQKPGQMVESTKETGQMVTGQAKEHSPGQMVQSTKENIKMIQEQLTVLQLLLTVTNTLVNTQMI